MKRIHLSILLICFALHFTVKLAAQNTFQNTLNNSTTQQLENISENTLNENEDYTSLLEGLRYYSKHPINLNNTSKEELQQLRLLNDIQINNLLNHLKKNGKLIVIYELQTIKYFDIQTINKIIPFVKVADKSDMPHFSIKELFSNGQNQLLLRYSQIIEKQKGFRTIESASLAKSPNVRYVGSPQKLYVRYRFNYGTNVSWGITADKDQGELFLKKNSGFDFYSAHFFLKNIGFVKALAIGDYQLTFGQGLTVWSGLSFGKSADILSVKKVASGISPYTSADENRFMRGVATSLRFKKIEATGFVSHKKVDATISDTLPDGDTQSISALLTTGSHATASELANKDAATQTLTGGNISYKGQQLTVGITAIDFQLNKSFDRTLRYYNQFEFSAKHNVNIGIDYTYVFKNFNFFGEQALSKNGGMAFVNGVLVSLDKRLSLTVIQRNYQRNYQNLMSNSFAESSKTTNEKGTYIGISIKPTNTISINAYVDRFEFPWMKFKANAPSLGNDFVAQITYTPSKKTAFYFRIRQRNKQKNSKNSDSQIDYLVPVKQNNYRFNIVYTITPSIKLKNRVELIDYKLDNNKTEKGYLAYQDVQFKKAEKPLSLTLRYALFQTDSYNSRIYAYENDLLYSYSIPAYYKRGSRFYILLNYKVNRSIHIWIRYSQTFYDNQHTISEGALSEITGNTKSEIKAQVRFKF